jgi:alkylation response protein AidB-like acyl-CoA dehydrogenase
MSNEALIEAAARLADDVLFPRAIATDNAGTVPTASLDVIAGAGFYGLFGPKRFGGLDADPSTAGLVIEALAGGCLTSAFIWAQHHVAVRLASAGSEETAQRWAKPLCTGVLRAGVAFAHLRREGLAPITARPDGEGWRIDGTAAWMTGWGAIDVINVAAVCDDRIVWFLCDAVEGPSVRVDPVPLSAVNSSGTVTLHLTDHVVAPDRVLGVNPLGEWRSRDGANLRQNGSFPLGLALRCARLIGEAGASIELAVDGARAELDARAQAEDVEGLAAARAEATWLAVRASAALTVAGAGRSMITDAHAQRLGREAMFLLVQGQTAPIRAAQLRLLL